MRNDFKGLTFLSSYILLNPLKILLRLVLMLLVFLILSCTDEASTTQANNPVIDIPIIEGDIVQINSGQGAQSRQNPAKLLFNDSGDGIAVWVSYTGTGWEYLYALYDQVLNTWSAAQILDSDTGVAPDYRDLLQLIQADTDGTSFAVVWKKNKSLLVSVYNRDNSNQWTNPVLLDSPLNIPASSLDLKVAALKNFGYAVSWENDTGIFAAVFNGSAWTNQAFKVVNFSDPTKQGMTSFSGVRFNSRNKVQLIGVDNAFYLFAAKDLFQINNSAISVPHVLVSRFGVQNQSWSTPVIINDTTIAGTLNGISATENDKGLLVSWVLNNANNSSININELYTNIFHFGANWDGQSFRDEVLTPIDSVNVGLAADSNGFTLLWHKPAISANGESVIIQTYDQTSQQWLPSVELDNPQFVSHLAISSDMIHNFAIYATDTGLFVSANVAGSDQWQAPTLVTSSVVGAQVQLARKESTFMLAWLEPGGTNSMGSQMFTINAGQLSSIAINPLAIESDQTFGLYIDSSQFWLSLNENTPIDASTAYLPKVIPFDPTNNQWLSPVALRDVPGTASSVYPQLLVNDSGNRLATWWQLINDRFELWGSIQIADIWGEPQALLTASEGVSPLTSFNLNSLFAMAPAANGGFILAWQTDSAIYNRVFDGNQWLVPQVALTMPAIAPLSISLVQSASGHLLFWGQTDGTPGAKAAKNLYFSSGVDSQWSVPKPLLVLGQNDNVESIRALTNANNDTLLAWDHVTDNVLAGGGLLHSIYAITPIILTDEPQTRAKLLNAENEANRVLGLEVSANLNGEFMVAWSQSLNTTAGYDAGIYSVRYDQTMTWQASEKHGNRITPIKLASNGSGFALATTDTDSIIAYIYRNNSWVQTQLNLPMTSFGSLDHFSLASNDDQYALVMEQFETDIRRNTYMSQFNGNSWSPSSPLVNAQSSLIQRIHPLISSNQGKYSVIWTQMDQSIDSVSAFIWILN